MNGILVPRTVKYSHSFQRTRQKYLCLGIINFSISQFMVWGTSTYFQTSEGDREPETYTKVSNDLEYWQVLNPSLNLKLVIVHGPIGQNGGVGGGGGGGGIQTEELPYDFFIRSISGEYEYVWEVSSICSIFLKIKQFTGPLKWHEILRICTQDTLCYL